MNEQLQRQRAADHGIAPRAAIRALVRPAAPIRCGCIQARLDVVAPRKDERLLVSRAQRDQSSAALPGLEVPEDRLLVDLRLAGVPGTDSQRVRAVRGDRAPSADLQFRRPRAVREGGGDPPPHRDLPSEAVHSPDQLARGAQLGVRQGHGVRYADHATSGGECGLENVGVGEVAPAHLRFDFGLQREAPAAVGVESRGEHAGGVELR